MEYDGTEYNPEHHVPTGLRKGYNHDTYIYSQKQPTPAERLTLNVFVASVSLVVGFVAGILLVIYG